RWNEAGQPTRSAAELVIGLKATWQVIHDTLNHWTPADLIEIVHDTDENGEDQTYTRQWVIWHLIEHDLHHGGELSFTLGMHKLAGITI
ncbi:MAG: DinB family protein, partial [Chloroflexi bacterium]|nr:DinB family protein [Chloroflexota bacterium]